MFILYTGQFFETETAIIRAKQGGRRVRSLASKIATTQSAERLALLYLVLVKMGDNLNAEVCRAKGERLDFWQGEPTQGVDFEVRQSGREYGSARLSDYLGVPQEARLQEVRAAAAQALQAHADGTATPEQTQEAENLGAENAEHFDRVAAEQDAEQGDAVSLDHPSREPQKSGKSGK